MILKLVTDLVAGDIPGLNLNEYFSSREEVKVYPNPATSEAAFEVQDAQHRSLTIKFYDLKGSRVMAVAKDAGDDRRQSCISGWPQRLTGRGMFL